MKDNAKTALMDLLKAVDKVTDLLVQEPPIHEFELGDYIVMVEPAKGFTSARVGEIWQVVGYEFDLRSKTYIIKRNNIEQVFSQNDTYLGKYVKIAWVPEKGA